MPIKKSAFKAVRQTKKRTLHNKKIQANIHWIKHQLTKFMALKDKEKSKEFYLKLQKALDKAVQKNILKKNTVSRYKSRLSQKVNAMK